MPFVIGENVGPYRIIHQLGQGGMATVFKAYHAALDRYVAIKALHPAFMEDPNFLARFQREARVVARLDHPNIVPIYDYAEHAGQPYLVMKFIEGETLKARMKRGPLGKGEGLKIVEAVGQALSYAHERGVLHRDIKPSNVLLAEDGMIYLADFGLARIAQAGESTLSNDMLLGTPQYISPEQARGAKELDAGTDIYSFGVVLYEMVVGRVPFSADTPFSIIHDHIYTPLPMPRAVNPRVPQAIERVLLKALAKERSDRFETIDDLVEAFRRAAMDGDVGVMVAPVPAETLPVDAPATEPPATESPGTALPQGQTAVEAQGGAERRPRRRWAWVIAGVALACVCLFAFAAVAGDLFPQEQPVGGAPPPAPTAVRDAPPLSPIEEARAAVAADPGNPQVYFELASVLYDDGQRSAAMGAFSRGVQILLDDGAYLEAADVLVGAMRDLGEGEQVDRRLFNQLNQALFLGAIDPAVLELIDELRVEFRDVPMWDVVSARAYLYQGDMAASMEHLDAVLTRRPEDPMARAVLAEWHLHNGEPERALEIVEALLAKPDFDPWLIEHLGNLKGEIEAAP